MTSKSETITFFGSGPVAAESLKLLAKNFVIEAVVTKPKPAHHRGSFPVIDLASDLKLPILTVTNKAELSALFASNPVTSKLGVLIDFGIIVTQDVIDYFPLGIVNSHFSLLPEWRGADPITFSILSGQKKTGVSLMLLDKGMDTGKIIAQKSLVIKPQATTKSLTHELIELSDQLLNEHLPKYIDGLIKPRNQSHPDRATYSRKLSKDDGIIDWSKPAEQIEREIRAYIDWPKSSTQIAGKEVIITKAHTAQEVSTKGLAMKTGKDLLVIDYIKPAGGKEMTSQAFLAGHKHLL
jgi:methionyl-tRNA formyltransferase